MQTVFYTQRVEVITSYGERRDCADQNIPRFIEACGYLPVPVPNVWSVAEGMLAGLRPAGIVLTGGNSLEKYGGDAPERDDVEKRLLEYAMSHDIAVYGFCRGMQVIMDYFGCELQTVKGHVALRHRLTGYPDFEGIEVNSYHNQGCCAVQAPLEAIAWTGDGVAEAVCYKEKRILGTMWHPEREDGFCGADVKRVRDLFGTTEER